MGLLLPDHWSGKEISKEGNGSASLTLKSTFINSLWVDWKRVAIVCSDKWATTGLRHLLASFGGVRLHIFTQPPDPVQSGEFDVVIWMRERFDSLPELAGEVFRFRRTQPAARQLVISDFLPPGLTFLSRGLMDGVTLVRGQDGVSTLRNKIAELISGRPIVGPLMGKTLSPCQWRVLFLMANGANIREIADINGIAIKTVFTHRTQAMLRLGLRNLVELAFILRCIQQMLAVMPAISRKVLQEIRK
jgi:DNA-binding CsgD family transcriptional regulator